MPKKGETKLTKELASELFDRIASGESIRVVCKSVEIAPITFYRWIDTDEELRAQYARAKELAMEQMAEDIQNISDDSHADEKFITDSNGNVIPVCNTEFVQRSKLRVDTRKWLMSKLAPKKYGEKSTTELVGKDGKDLPISIIIGEKQVK